MEKKLMDVDFYNQACAYFFYHADQRTKMIQYFVAVFAASLALYGSLLGKYPLASAFVALFQIMVSIIFCFIDKRNKFLVEQSENVIRQIEEDYNVNVPTDKYAYGVFSNEEHAYKFLTVYHKTKRKKEDRIKKLCDDGACNKKIEYEIKKEFSEAYGVSGFELKKEIHGKKIFSFSRCVQWLYNMCTAISVVSVIIAILVLFGVI